MEARLAFIPRGDFAAELAHLEEQFQQQVAQSVNGGGVKRHQMSHTVYKRRRKAHLSASGGRGTSQLRRDLFLGYASAMAYCEDYTIVPVARALQVYHQLLLEELSVDGELMERLLRNATSALVEIVRQGRRKGRKDHVSLRQKEEEEDEENASVVVNFLATDANIDLDVVAPSQLVDPLLCGVCEDLLKVPVTAPCGHTFCRQCAASLQMCNRCPDQGPCGATASDSGEGLYGLEKDVIISRLVDKWWGAELKAECRNEKARFYLEAGQLDQALRCVNESLEQGTCGLIVLGQVG